MRVEQTAEPRARRLLAVLLAAGLGSRLGGVPKCLFRVGGVPLVDRCLDLLAETGLANVLVVTGHGADAVRAHLESGEPPLEVRFVHNPRYGDLNNFHTLRLALEGAEAPRVLVVNGDVVCRRAVLAATLATQAPLVLAVEAGSVDQEALKVEVEADRVIRLGKAIPAERALGEFIGVSALEADVQTAYVAAAEAALAAGETDLYYEDLFSGLVATWETQVAPVERGSWAEIDTPADVSAAEAVVAGPSSPAGPV